MKGTATQKVHRSKWGINKWRLCNRWIDCRWNEMLLQERKQAQTKMLNSTHATLPRRCVVYMCVCCIVRNAFYCYNYNQRDNHIIKYQFMIIILEFFLIVSWYLPRQFCCCCCCCCHLAMRAAQAHITIDGRCWHLNKSVCAFGKKFIDMNKTEQMRVAR